MPLKRIISKSTLKQLSSVELKKLEKLENTHRIIGEKMLQAQQEYTRYTRNNKDSNSPKARTISVVAS